MAVNVATQTMMRLPSNELMSLQEDFESNPDGLLPAEFVRVMLNRAAQKAAHGGADDGVAPLVDEATGAPNLGAVAELLELFEQIDANGDGSLEWDEFVQVVVDQRTDTDTPEQIQESFKELAQNRDTIVRFERFLYAQSHIR